jgi:hypothetical protein
MEPPFDLNPLTQIWRTIDAFHVFTHFFIKYFELAKMAIVHVLGSLKDERFFFISCISLKQAMSYFRSSPSFCWHV